MLSVAFLPFWQMYNHVMRRLNSRERVKIMWHKTYPKVTQQCMMVAETAVPE
jgi:hypothetical protein